MEKLSVKERKHLYYMKNREKILQKTKDRDSKDPGARGRAWYQANKGPELRAKRAAYDRKRYSSNPMVRLAKCMRVRLNEVLGQKKSSKTVDLVGCDFEFLKKHLESQFQPGMSWDNYGKWEVDHIIPLASAINEEDLKKLCRYENLQPLWALENRTKQKKIKRVG